MKTHSRWFRWLTVLLLVSVISLQPRPAHAGLLTDDLQQLLQSGLRLNTRVIIQTKDRPSNLLTATIALLGGTVLGTFDSINGVAASLPLVNLPLVARLLEVERISPDLPVTGLADYTSPAVGATAARRSTGLDGRGIGVAVLDTGVAPHKDLVSPDNRIVGWKDLVNGRLSPYDDSGHGTHVAGIIAGNGAGAAAAGEELRGMAPGASIIGVKILDAQMRGYTSTVIRALDYCRANRSRYNIRVVNLSLGQVVQESYRTDPLCRAVESLWKSGIVVVVSAGNLGRQVAQDPESGTRYGSITCPGNDPAVITVGATRSNHTPEPTDDEMASYSSRGPTRFDGVLKPDVVAPGNQVLSLWSGGALTAERPECVVTYAGTRYFRMSGTSMAAPVVAGAVALLLQADGTLSPDTVKVRLMHSAVKRWNANVPAYSPNSRGAGLLNIPAALQEPEKAACLAFSPRVRFNPATRKFALVAGQALWGSLSLLGGERRWNDQAVWAEGSSYYDPASGQMVNTGSGTPTTYYDPYTGRVSTPPAGTEAPSGSYPEYYTYYEPNYQSPPAPGAGSQPVAPWYTQPPPEQDPSYTDWKEAPQPPPADDAQILWGEPTRWEDP